MSVVPLSEVKTHLNIPAGDTTNDAELQTIIDAAESKLAQRVGPLAPTAVTERVRGDGCALVLSTTPVISLTSVTPAGGTALVVSDLVSDDGVVEYSLSGTFADRPHTVIYQAGYSTLPKDLVLAVKELVRHLWQTQRGSAGARRPGSAASDSTANTVPGAAYLLPFRVQELISDYEQPGFA